MEKIGQDLIQGFAPLYFEAAKQHLVMFRNIQESTGQYSYMRNQVEMFMRTSGLTSGDMIRTEYNPIMLNNEEFRTVVILYTCTCILCSTDKMGIPCFREFMMHIQDSFGHKNTHDVVKYFSDIFDIDPGIIPDYVKTGMALEFEEREADKICEKSFEKLDGPDGYSSYEQYSEYMLENSKSITHNLNVEGYTNTFDPDMLAKLMILKKLNFPVPTLYSVQKYLPFPGGLIDVLTKKLFTLRQSGGFSSSGGFFDLDDLGDD